MMPQRPRACDVVPSEVLKLDRISPKQGTMIDLHHVPPLLERQSLQTLSSSSPVPVDT